LANHKSAKKRARQTPKRTARNMTVKRAMRTLEKKVCGAIDSKDKDKANELFKSYMSFTAKASQKGVLNSKTASRKIGRIATRVSSI